MRLSRFISGFSGKSLLIAAITTFLCLVFGFPVALGIAFAQPKTKAWLLLLIMLPFWTNLLIRTYALIAVLRTEGYINQSFHWLWDNASGLMTLIGVPGFGDYQPMELLHNNFAVIFGLIYVHLPFMVLPLYSALDNMDRSLMEASLDLGAGHFRTLFGRCCAAGGARHRLGHSDHLHSSAWLVSDARSFGRAGQPDDRQRDRAAIQARQ